MKKPDIKNYTRKNFLLVFVSPIFFSLHSLRGAGSSLLKYQQIFNNQIARAKNHYRALGLFFFSLLLTVAIASCQTPQQAGSGDIIICSKNFTEQLILGEILSQHIEATTKLKVNRSLGLAGSLCHQSIVAGKVDAYVEYTGNSFTDILKEKPITDAKEVYRQVKQQYADKFKLEVTKPLGFENTFAMIIRGSDARSLGI